jgi:hypothetical protein
MKPNHDQKLEARITRELKSLGDLPAPASLAARVLHAIEQRVSVPWYRRAWTTWPLGLQVASLVLLAAAFAGICWLGGGVSQSATETVAAQKNTGWFAQLGFIWNLLRVFGEALVAVANYVGKGTIIAIALLLATTYAACVGLGTAYVRFALNHARRF